MVWTEGFTLAGDGLAQESFRLGVASLTHEQKGEPGHIKQSGWVRSGASAPAGGNRLFQSRLRFFEKAQIQINVAHSTHQLGLHLGIPGQIRINLLETPDENFTGGNRVASGLRWIGHFEHVNQKLCNPVGSIAFPDDSLNLKIFKDAKTDQKSQGGGREGCTHFMALYIFLQLISCAWRAGDNWLIPQKMRYIRRKFRNGAIAAVAFARQGFHRNPIEVASKEANQMRWLHVARGRSGRHC